MRHRAGSCRGAAPRARGAKMSGFERHHRHGPSRRRVVPAGRTPARRSWSASGTAKLFALQVHVRDEGGTAYGAAIREHGAHRHGGGSTASVTLHPNREPKPRLLRTNPANGGRRRRVPHPGQGARATATAKLASQQVATDEYAKRGNASAPSSSKVIARWAAFLVKEVTAGLAAGTSCPNERLVGL